MINNLIKPFAKYAGIAAVSMEWLALLLYYWKMPSYFGGRYPISYFATLPQTRSIFIVCYTLAGLFAWIFFKYHLNKYYRVPMKVITLSAVLFVGLALFPFDPKDIVSNIIHDTLGLSSGFLFIISTFTTARNSNDRYIYRVSLGTIILSSLLFLIFFLSTKDSRLTFVLEVGAWLVWQIWVLWISYYSHK